MTDSVKIRPTNHWGLLTLKIWIKRPQMSKTTNNDDSMGLHVSSFTFLQRAPKYTSFLKQRAYQSFKVIQGR